MTGQDRTGKIRPVLVSGADRTLAYTEFTFAVVYTAKVNAMKMVVSLYIH